LKYRETVTYPGQVLDIWISCYKFAWLATYSTELVNRTDKGKSCGKTTNFDSAPSEWLKQESASICHVFTSGIGCNTRSSGRLSLYTSVPPDNIFNYAEFASFHSLSTTYRHVIVEHYSAQSEFEIKCKSFINFSGYSAYENKPAFSVFELTVEEDVVTFFKVMSKNLLEDTKKNNANI
jgi:hypothetical protein